MKIIDYKKDNYKLILMSYFNCDENNISIICVSSNEIDFIIDMNFINEINVNLFTIIKDNSHFSHIRIKEIMLNEIILNKVLLKLNKG